MPDIKKMEGPVKFKKGLELYFDPKKDMFYDPKKKKYMSEKELLALGDVVESYHSKKKKMKESSCGTEKKKMKEDDIFEKSEEYQKFFQSALKKFGIDSPAELDDKKKKEFFDYVDANWEGENEEDEEETVEENCGSKHKKMEEDKDFKPHMMYDPKTGKAYKAEKPEDHERMSKLGYTHEKPKKIEELSLEEAIEEAKEWKVGAPVFIVISYHTNGKHSTTVLRTKEKAMKFAKDEEYHEDDVKGTAVLDMKVGKFIDKETGKHIKEENTEERIQEMFDLGDKVKRKDGSEEGEVVQRKIEDKSVGGRYKLKLKNGSRSKWINGNSLELVEQFSNKMKKYVDACGKDFTNWK